MPHSSSENSSPRLLATAMGVALSSLSVASMVQADEAENGDEALQLGNISVVGEEETSSYKAESASRKYTAPLRETPKSVTVISEQVIKDTGSLTLTDALRTTSGITFGAGEGGNPAGDRPIIRGFNAESDVFIDGLRDVGMQTREMFNLEQVEVSKGPGSAYTGAGSTGGSLNLISKSAKASNFLDISQTFGTDQTTRTTLDGNYVFSDSVAGRLNLMKHDANVAGRDGVSVSRWGIAPTISFGMNGPTRATLSYYHLESDDVPDYGLPLYTAADVGGGSNKRKPAHVSKDNFYGSADDYRESTTDTGTFLFEHDLNDNLTLSNSFRMSRTTLDYIGTNPNDSKGAVTGGIQTSNLLDGYVYRGTKNRNSNNTSWINQTDLKATFNTGSIEHTLVTGIEVSKVDVHSRGYTITGAGSGVCRTDPTNCTSLTNPSRKQGLVGNIARAQNYTDTNTDTLAGYVFDTLKFNEQWSLNLGLRYDDYDTTSKGFGALTSGRNGPTGLYERDSNSHFWNYQAGLVFNPTSNGSIYLAWSTSSNPVGETSGEGGDEVSVSNLNLQPERNRNLELGTKWDFFDERLGLEAAIFKTQKKNARVNDADGLPENIGETEVKGFELGVNGQITPKWNVFASYTYLDGELKKGAANASPSEDGNEIPSTPENSFSAWTTYNVTDKFIIGGGANYVDSRFGNTANTTEIPSYWRYDAMAKFVLNKNVDFQLNVQNLTDERYFDQIYSTHMAHVAPGRTALLSTNFHF
jgi:catecholate siderophore receptor